MAFIKESIYERMMNFLINIQYMNHFVDYLTCKDVALAYDLNEMLLRRPRRALRQFALMCQLMNRELCKHEVLGRGYVFSREPVMSPSVLVGRLVLREDAERLHKGMQFLWILDADFVEHQRSKVQGVELERIERSCLMLTEAYGLLHASAAWSEAHFVDVLKEMAIFDPDLACSLHLVSSSHFLAMLISQSKRMMRRFVDI